MAYQSEIEKLEQRYQENPKQWFAALADAYRKNGNLDLALEYVKGGLEMRPDYASGHIVLGRCLLDKNEDEAASNAFEHVLELDAENIIALKSLSDIAQRRGDTVQARRWLTRLLEVDPMNDEARESLDGLGGPISAAEAEAAAAAPADDEVEVPAEPETPPVAATEPGAAWAAEALAEAHRKEQEDTAPSQPEAAASEPPRSVPADPTSPPPAAVQELPDDLMIERTSGEEVPMEAPGAGPMATGPEAAAGLERPVESEAELDREPSIKELEAEIGDQKSVSEEMGVVSFDDPSGWVEADASSSEPVGVDPEDLAPAIDFLGDPEGVAASQTESSPDVPPAEFEEPQGGDLPLIVPSDSYEAEAPAEPEARSQPDEPEPVVTETMAEVYAKQGLFDQAREIYQKLLERHPGVALFEQRLRELADQASATGAPVDSGRSRYSASATGGESAVDYLRRIFSGESGAAETTEHSPPESDREFPSTESALASAFGNAPDTLGSPTVPASDDVSLASVFGGDRHAPPGSPSGSEPPPPKENAVSFDEFYGAKEKDKPSEEAPPKTDDDESPDEDFKHWLEGLKT